MRFLEAGDLSRAEALVRAHLARAPHNSDALRLLSAIAAATGHFAEAERLLRQTAAGRRELIGAYTDQSSLLCRIGRADDAITLLDRMIVADPESIWPLSIKSGVLSAERRTGEVLKIHRELVERAPNATVLWMNYANSLSAVGQTDEAIAAYRRSLQLDPANGAAWWGLANLRTILLDDDDVEAMERILPQIGDPFQKIQIQFALGKACGDQGRFEQSFGYYRQANALRGTVVPYDPQAIRETVLAHEEILTPSVFAERRGYGHESDEAIFIIGMPRSGSTLVEQILASHPMVEGAGELFELQEIAAALPGNDPSGKSLPNVLFRLMPNDRKVLGQRYLDATRRHRRSGLRYFTDKMPANWRFAPLIHLILPNAKIVDVRREPLSCCVSTFLTYFNRESRLPTDLYDLGCYYNDYRRMMDYMDTVLPARVHRVHYEKLVESPEAEVRRLLDYLGLDFDPCCLRFYENPRAVHTPSAQQVRTPINRSGLDRWRNYEPWLSPLAMSLNGSARK